MAQVDMYSREREHRVGRVTDGSGGMDKGAESSSNKLPRWRVSSLGDADTTETISCRVMHLSDISWMVKFTMFWQCPHGSATGTLVMWMTRKEGRGIAVRSAIGISSS